MSVGVQGGLNMGVRDIEKLVIMVASTSAS